MSESLRSTDGECASSIPFYYGTQLSGAHAQHDNEARVAFVVSDELCEIFCDLLKYRQRDEQRLRQLGGYIPCD